MNLPFKEILGELNYFEYLDGEWDYFPEKYQVMFTKYMNKKFKYVTDLKDKYSFIDTYFKESCGMSYKEAVDLCHKGKEVHEKIKDLQKDFAPNGIY